MEKTKPYFSDQFCRDIESCAILEYNRMFHSLQIDIELYADNEIVEYLDNKRIEIRTNLERSEYKLYFSLDHIETKLNRYLEMFFADCKLSEATGLEFSETIKKGDWELNASNNKLTVCPFDTQFGNKPYFYFFEIDEFIPLAKYIASGFFFLKLRIIDAYIKNKPLDLEERRYKSIPRDRTRINNCERIIISDFFIDNLYKIDKEFKHLKNTYAITNNIEINQNIANSHKADNSDEIIITKKNVELQKEENENEQTNVPKRITIEDNTKTQENINCVSQENIVVINIHDNKFYQRIFIDIKAIELFEYLLDKFKGKKISHADCSFIFRQMKHDEYIYELINESEFRTFLSNSYEIVMDKLKTLENCNKANKMSIYSTAIRLICNK